MNHYYPVMFESIFTEGGLSLERLRVLIEVHDAGSIAAAAPGDPVRHSQYSRQLAELSQFLGREVAGRQGRILKLTPDGIRLAEMARPFLRELQDFHADCHNLRIEFTVAAGDSLLQWLVVPRLGGLLKTHPQVRFTTLNLRTHEIGRQIADTRVDFGLLRKSAVPPGMKPHSLGTLTFVAIVPTDLVTGKKPPTFAEVLTGYPLAMQTTDGQFSKQLREIARAEKKNFRPALACESFPQTLAAVRSRRFAAIVPELAVKELPAGLVHQISAPSLARLQREIVLVWNPRVIKVRSHAAKVLAALQTALRFG